MTTIDIVRMAREANELHEEQMRRAGWRKCAEGQSVTQHCGLLEAAVKAERDRCCRIVYGMAGSDNVAQRTVEAIRGET